MGLKFVALCTQITALAFVMGKSDGIQCYNCQAPIPESGEDPCKEAPLETCPPASAWCLSAKFSVSAKPLKNEEEVISALTCFPDMNGHECEFFLKKVQQNTPPLFQVKYDEECKVCPTDGCNSASDRNLSPLICVAAGFFVFFATLF